MAQNAKKMQIRKIPDEVKGFELVNFDELEKQAYTDLYKQLGLLRIEDYRWRNKKRALFGYSVLVLLILQNVVVFSLLVWALWTGAAERLQILLPVVVPATLLETAALVQIVLRFVFNEINYFLPRPS